MKHLLTCLTLLLSFSAQAQYVNGNRLYERMTSSNTSQTMWALGYVTGVADSFDGEFFCLPNTVTVGQMSDIVQKSLVARPQERHLRADVLIMLALVDVFPCKKGGGV